MLVHISFTLVNEIIFSCILEDEPWPEDMSPDNRPPFLQEGQMYFPKGAMCSPRTPEELPTMPELSRHRFTPDRDQSRMSHQTAFGGSTFWVFVRNFNFFTLSGT